MSQEFAKLTPHLQTILEQEGYQYIREIPGQGVCALERMAYTVALSCGLDETGKRYRYCYHGAVEAYSAIKTWDGDGHPPGNWIKRKGEGGDIPNPDYEGCGVVV